MSETLPDLVARFPRCRVLVVGDVMLDEYIWGEVRRISPEAPVPVVEIRRRSHVPGGAANTAMNVVSLGGHAAICGAVGDDAQAVQLRDVLEQAHIQADGLIVTDDRPTTTKTRIAAHNQQIARVDAEQRAPLTPTGEDALLAWIGQQVPLCDACVLSDYAKGVVTPRVAAAVIELARAADKPIVVDPKGTNYERYRGATVITPNVHEATHALGADLDADVIDVGRQLSALLSGTAVLLTRGAEGMTLFRNGDQCDHVPALARHVYDVTGAGDTVVGALTLALAAGAPLDDAIRLANRAAGVVVEKFGTATATVAELLGVGE